jgi:hypothetical protein
MRTVDKRADLTQTYIAFDYPTIIRTRCWSAASTSLVDLCERGVLRKVMNNNIFLI